VVQDVDRWINFLFVSNLQTNQRIHISMSEHSSLNLLLRSRSDFFRRYNNQRNIQTYLSNEHSILNLINRQQASNILQNLSFSLIPSNNGSFLDPVIVAPSSEQLDAAFVTPVDPPEGSCPICQDVFAPTDTTIRLRHCNHCFHRDCAVTWYRVSVFCPMCRHDIRTAS
jgi:hypothetical protein